MQYTMRSGYLYQEPGRELLAQVRSSLSSPVKTIVPEQGESLCADVRFPDPDTSHSGDVRCKEYVLTGSDGAVVARAKPRYHPDSDPDVHGWPLCRLPRVDRAQLTLGGRTYSLIMHSGGDYVVCDPAGSVALRITHRGMPGGWHLEDAQGFTPAVLCGLFAFCRYIEQENEFVIV